MKLKTDTVDVNGVRYSVTQLPPIRSFNLLPKVMKIVAPALAEGIKRGITLESSIIELAPLFALFEGENINDVMRELFSTASAQLPDETGRERILELTSQESINEVFGGRLFDMYQVLIFAFQVNYTSFLGGGEGE